MLYKYIQSSLTLGSVSNRGCFDAPAIPSTFTAGHTGLILFRLTNQGQARRPAVKMNRIAGASRHPRLKSEVQKLQRIQNIAARLVVKAKRTDHTSPILQQLHWLPVSERISFKILLLTYKTVNGYAPSYIEDLVNHYVPSRSLRSTSQGLLTVPRSTTLTCGDRAFSIAAPRLWNTLPLMIMPSQSLPLKGF